MEQPYIPDFLKSMYERTDSETGKGWIVTLAGILNFFVKLATGATDGIKNLLKPGAAATGAPSAPAKAPVNQRPEPEFEPVAPATPAAQRPAQGHNR